MSTFDRVVFILNGLGAFAAFGVSVIASLTVDPRKRPLYAAIGMVALINVAGFVWVLNTERIEQWADFYRGIGFVAWVVVWCLPALLDIGLHRRDARTLTREVER